MFGPLVARPMVPSCMSAPRCGACPCPPAPKAPCVMWPALTGAPDAERRHACEPVPEISMIFNGFSTQSLGWYN
ncbi:hypothetical protein KKY_3036 [Pelagibacterium halotolerans B2]|uniref:Uncharacterized protein n=1 Tax=Pelagibacterium halotolerans (strain DSM 22347 / JCM 15775 / CGMCC 1.7692 / B2) TaxID=1082931 RepID=G4RFM7_PELHB|nr:hypothetical protein KKY_3036 [Pelagibacterium halotolerans B2]